MVLFLLAIVLFKTTKETAIAVSFVVIQND